MDIQAWLEETADREPPDAEQHEGSRDHPGICKDRGLHADEARKGRSNTPRDSSVIDLHRFRHRRRSREHPQDLAERANVTARRRRDSLGSSASYGRPQSKPAVANTFEKRARHKTKPDRYEPKSRKHRKDRSAQVQAERKVKRRRSHRSADGARTTGLVQSFQLKTGAKDSRLTLKADKEAGLFKHGKASAAVPGRGAGLPDLVFNEMRFLRQPKNRQHEFQQEQHDQVNARRRLNEEVSTHFALDRQPTVDSPKRVTHLPNPKRPDHTTRAEPREKTPNVPGVAKRPLLGFGCRGQRLKKQGSAVSNSYFSWSESHRSEPQREAGNHQARHGADMVEDREVTHRNHGDPRPPAEATRTALRAGKSLWPAGAEHPVSASMPLPSEPPVRFVVDEPPSAEFNTSDILQVHLADLAHSDPCFNTQIQGEDMDKENQEPRSSTSLGDLLRQAEQAIEQKEFPPPNKAAPLIEHSPTPRPVQPSQGLRERRLQSANGLRHSFAPTRRANLPIYYQLDSHMVPTDHEMLDVSPDYGFPLKSDASARDRVPETDDLCDCARCISPQWTEQPGSVVPESGVPYSVPYSSPGFDVSERLLKVPEMPAMREEEEDELGGFWKPNVLY